MSSLRRGQGKETRDTEDRPAVYRGQGKDKWEKRDTGSELGGAEEGGKERIGRGTKGAAEMGRQGGWRGRGLLGDQGQQ